MAVAEGDDRGDWKALAAAQGLVLAQTEHQHQQQWQQWQQCSSAAALRTIRPTEPDLVQLAVRVALAFYTVQDSSVHGDFVLPVPPPPPAVQYSAVQCSTPPSPTL